MKRGNIVIDGITIHGILWRIQNSKHNKCADTYYACFPLL